MSAAYATPHDRRLAALALTALVHVLLLLGWQAARRLPPLPAAAEPAHIQWIDLSPRPPAPPRPAQAPARTPAPVRTPEHTRAQAPAREAAPPAMTLIPTPSAPVRPADRGALPASPASSSPGAAQADAAQADAAPSTLSAGPAGGSLVQGALRAAGSVASDLRKENRAYIVAPPDSPQMRMRRGMQAAHDMVPPKLWEAPKIDELVNNTGDGTRHTRINTGNGTYCINERSTHVSIDTVETLGKVTPYLTCPQHETPAGSQEWKSARD